MTIPIPFEWFFLILRLAFVAVLYVFLWQVLRIIMRDLRQTPTRPAKRKSSKAKLIVLDPAASDLAAGSTFSIANSATVGRHPECSLVIEEPSISAIHAEIAMRNLAWYVTDRGSTNGTFINGRPVSGAGYVETDDVIQIGRVKFRFIA